MTRRQFEDVLIDTYGEAWTRSYFERSRFVEGELPVLHPWSLVANDKFRGQAGWLLKREGVRLGDPICEHLKTSR